jgi:phosphotriesterase-related protein
VSAVRTVLLREVGGRLAELFVAELTHGMDDGRAPKAGMTKVAGGFHGLDAHARHVLTAAARAYHETGPRGPTTRPTGGCSTR